MKNLYLTVPAFLLLTACGGGSSNPVEEREVVEVTEEEEQNNEIAQDVIEQNEEEEPTIIEVPPAEPEVFTLPALKMLASNRVREENGSVLRREAPVLDEDAVFIITVNPDGTVSVDQGGRTVTVVENADGVFRGSIGDGDEATELDVTFIPEFEAGDVRTGLVIAVNYDERIEGYVPIGQLAETAIVDGKTGTATFRGLMNGRISGPLDDAFTAPINGLGGGSLTVDFTNDTVSGNFSLRHPSNAFNVVSNDDEFPRMNVTLEESAITGNGFGGDAAITFADGGGLGTETLTPGTDGSYTGNFYGDTATSAGGTVSSTFDKDGDTFTFQGGFSTAE